MRLIFNYYFNKIILPVKRFNYRNLLFFNCLTQSEVLKYHFGIFIHLYEYYMNFLNKIQGLTGRNNSLLFEDYKKKLVTKEICPNNLLFSY